MSVSDKLTQLNSIKTDIKNAINAKGVSVGDDMTTYANAISNIRTASTGYNLQIEISDATMNHSLDSSWWNILVRYADNTTQAVTLQIQHKSAGIILNNVIGYTMTNKSVGNWSGSTSAFSARGYVYSGSGTTLRTIDSNADFVALNNGSSIVILSDAYIHATLEN